MSYEIKPVATWETHCKRNPSCAEQAYMYESEAKSIEIDELRTVYEAQSHRANALALVVNDLTKICTSTTETKEQFIERVKAILSFDPDLRVSEWEDSYEALQKENEALAKRIAELELKTKREVKDLPWDDAEKLAENALIADALIAFSYDSTNDNAVGLIRYIVSAYNKIAR